MAYTKDIGLMDFYKEYKATCKKKEIECRDYKTFSTIIKDFNLTIRNKIVYESQEFKLPRRLGYLYIKKYENVYTEDNKYKWKVDYKKTKELGYVVYFGAKYGYRWYWDKKPCRVRGKKWFRFKACRTGSRAVADAIKNKNIDYRE